MSDVLLSQYDLGDMSACYFQDINTHAVELQLYPLGMQQERAVRRPDHKGNDWIAGLPANMRNRDARKSNSLVQLHVEGDAFYPNSPSQSMLFSQSTESLVYRKQEVITEKNCTRILTYLDYMEADLEIVHTLNWPRNAVYVESSVSVRNRGDRIRNLEMLHSFSLGGFSPFDSADSSERLRVHRYRTYWSRESRHTSQSIEEMNMAMPWILASNATERFGQVGSWPCFGWEPFVALEDIGKSVFWGAQLAHCGSWQMEIARRDDCIDLAGGLADKNFGHWSKKLAKDEVFTTPVACLSVVQGDLESLHDRMLTWQEDYLQSVASEEDLPIQFNDWCTHWGLTSHDKCLSIVEKLKSLPVKYFVIDSGWFRNPDQKNWNNAIGDWQESQYYFPKGLKTLNRQIRAAGMIPGIWMEFECAGNASELFNQTDHCLKLNGKPVTVGSRRFLDFRDPWVIEYVSRKVIDFLRENDFGYLKVDYNASVGRGVDSDDSIGEGLRQHLTGVQNFFRKIHEELPELVIENCASGGMRLEPSMQRLVSMGSFSDCHITREAAIIAANQQRMILPRQSLIWATIHADDSEDDLLYYLSICFLGRMCLSGELVELSEEKMNHVRKIIDFYREVYPIIAHGTSRRAGPEIMNYRHPQGYQIVVRSSEDKKEKLIVGHCFKKSYPEVIEFEIPQLEKDDKLQLSGSLSGSNSQIALIGGRKIQWRPGHDFDAILLKLTNHD